MNNIAMMNSQNYRQRDMVRQSMLCVNTGTRVEEEDPVLRGSCISRQYWLSFPSTLILVTSIL